MAYRPDPSELDEALSPVELNELHRRLSLLSPHHVQEAYRRAYKDCQMAGDILPRAAAIQELVTAWKLMRESNAGVPRGGLKPISFLIQPSLEPPVFGLQFRNQFDQSPILVAQERKLLHFFSSGECAYVVDVVPRPFGELVDPGRQLIRSHN